MDGASKFVRGDAIAGIIIVLINIVGGLIIGVLQHDLDVAHGGAELHACSPSATAWWRRSPRW